MTCLLPLGGEAAKSWPASDIFGDAHHLEVFEIDSSTGFMAPSPPPARLPADWEVWEATLDDAMESRVQLGNKIGLTKEEMTRSETWRANVRAVREFFVFFILAQRIKNRAMAHFRHSFPFCPCPTICAAPCRS